MMFLAIIVTKTDRLVILVVLTSSLIVYINLTNLLMSCLKNRELFSKKAIRYTRSNTIVYTKL